MKEFLLNFFTGALESAGEAKLVQVLQELHDTKPELYNAAVKGGHAFVLALQPLVDKSKTPIDDAVLKAIGEAITTSATSNGVEL
jgi:hypothetical protein